MSALKRQTVLIPVVLFAIAAMSQSNTPNNPT